MQDEVHVRSRRCCVAGLGDVKGCLVHGADQDVGQRLDRLGRKGAAVDAILEKGGDEPDGVAQADLPPPVPPQHRWAVEQDYALQAAHKFDLRFRERIFIEQCEVVAQPAPAPAETVVEPLRLVTPPATEGSPPPAGTEPATDPTPRPTAGPA